VLEAFRGSRRNNGTVGAVPARDDGPGYDPFEKSIRNDRSPAPTSRGST